MPNRDFVDAEPVADDADAGPNSAFAGIIDDIAENTDGQFVMTREEGDGEDGAEEEATGYAGDGFWRVPVG